jgi:hypothetical protein
VPRRPRSGPPCSPPSPPPRHEDRHALAEVHPPTGGDRPAVIADPDQPVRDQAARLVWVLTTRHRQDPEAWQPASRRCPAHRRGVGRRRDDELSTAAEI